MNIFQKFELKYDYPARKEVHAENFDLTSMDALYESQKLREWLAYNYMLKINLRWSNRGVRWYIQEPFLNLETTDSLFYQGELEAELVALQALYFIYDYFVIPKTIQQ